MKRNGLAADYRPDRTGTEPGTDPCRRPFHGSRRDRLAQRGPDAAKKQLADLEASYQAEAEFGKAEALRNVEKWTAIRKARGAAK